MITRPFNFEAQLTRPSLRMDMVPFINVCVILIFFSILGSRFVLAPGVAIALPVTKDAPPDVLLTSRVLTLREVQGGEMLIFEGKNLKLESFEKALEKLSAEAPREALHIRADGEVSTRLMVRVMELARRAGFGAVVLAAEPERAAATTIP